ncbi:two-component system sensor histidine kinase [Bifidobacterium sp. DSM 109958]|uniref:histidine kinase n=2 Tax=Bifidobacterium moraviense TaxID=2675323 RepID=A0A7Y0F0P6_9BIFI|nr:histidine kinase [Bifidobacterium sp. DSM 109958]NMM99879.1 two-component system sensor histidine kinase [Bifidobacterium sp. DSM 109958]
MAEKGLLLALCMACALIVRVAAASAVGAVGDAGSMASAAAAVVDASLVVALLTAVAASGAAEWLAASRAAWAPPAAFALLAVFDGDCRMFLPLAAFDAARIAPLMRSAMSARLAQAAAWSSTPWLARAATAARWLWALPLACLLLDARSGPAQAAAAALLVPAAAIGFALGADARRTATLRTLLRRSDDRLRESSRSIRVRLADVAEERAQSVRMATLGERSRIARDIHDNVGHLLTRAIMQTQAGRAVAEATGDATAAGGFAALGGTLDDAMTMVRRSVHDLEDDGVDFAAQIADASRAFADVGGRLAVHLENDVASAPAPVARCLATVIREALANVVHHSEAREATVTLRDFPAFWQLVVYDPGPASTAGASAADGARHGQDGMGGDPARGMGIADIEARVRALGGTASCGPYGAGWRVFAAVPKARWSESEGMRRDGRHGTDDMEQSAGWNGRSGDDHCDRG